MDPLTTLLIIVLSLIILGVFLNKRLIDLSEMQKPSNELLEYLKMTNVRLDEQGKSFNLRLDNAAKVIGDVQKNIGEMSEIGRGMKELQDFLKNPKIRGNIGEQILNELLKQYLPKDSFNLQYTFKSGEKVDAAIKTSAGIIPVDSKFPMENFRKISKSDNEDEKKSFQKLFESDVKKHIEDISRKYILTEEGTIDYALMYIPSEAVYYEVVNIQELSNFARRLRVYPVSPNTLYAHLQVLLLSFEGKDLEAKSRQVFRILRAIQKDYSKVSDNLSTLQKHLNNAYNIMSSVITSFTQLGQKITSTQSLGEADAKEVKKLKE